MSRHDFSEPYTFPCAVCGSVTQPKERHTFLDCLRAKRRNGRLTHKDMEALFRYAEKGEQAWFAERDETRSKGAA